MMKKALVKNKNDTKKRKMEKQKGIDIIEPINVENSDKETESDYDRRLS